VVPDSKVNGSRPDAVLFALDFRALPLKLSLGDEQAASATVEGVIGYLQALRNGVKAGSNAVCIFQTFAPPVESLFGSLDRALPGTMRSLIHQINHGLGEFVLGSGDVLLDVAGIAETVSLAEWHNPQLWNMAKFSFSDELIPLYADHLARVVAALRGKSRKVLILDRGEIVGIRLVCRHGTHWSGFHFNARCIAELSVTQVSYHLGYIVSTRASCLVN
jgi:predicted enzyme involved in methoxymalonyl-ACP biosynthesis